MLSADREIDEPETVAQTVRRHDARCTREFADRSRAATIEELRNVKQPRSARV
jgi:hypothetical protein